jgi:hypothetical protein
MFIIVREPEKQFRNHGFVLPDGRNVDLVMPFGMVRILTTVTPSLDPPNQLPSIGSGMLFMPQVSGSDFPFKLVATDIENNVLEFEAPLVFMERDHNDPSANILQSALDAYNTHALVDREFDLRGQKVAYADSAGPDDTILATNSRTWHVAPDAIDNVAQDEPASCRCSTRPRPSCRR